MKPEALNLFNNHPKSKHPVSGCIEWTGKLNAQGYGVIYCCGETFRCHRISLEQKLGSEIPIGKEACHTCDNRKCVNPEHLYAGTRKQNVADAINRGKMILRKAFKYCGKCGKEKSGENLIIKKTKTGFAHLCKHCKNLEQKKSYWNKKP